MVDPPMPRAAAVLAALFASLAAGPALAGEASCSVDRGAVVVSAAFGDITGDFILDLSAPRSVLHLDRAQMEGLTTPAVDGTLTLAGERNAAHLTIASIDARSLGLPTTLNGVIGADILAAYVVDLRFAPCRLRLWRGRAPPLRGAKPLPVEMIAGVPTVGASISDGHTALAGAFAISTGTPGVRVSQAVAALSRTPKGIDPTSRYAPPAHLSALGVVDAAILNASASLQPDAPPGVDGEIGVDVWSRYELRLDIGRRRLWLTPARLKRLAPVSGRRSARPAGS